MAVALGLCGWLIAGLTGVAAAAVAGLVTLAVRPGVSPEWLLRVYGGQPLPVAAAPEVHRLVQALAHRSGLSATPRLYYVPSRMLNAFAVGRPDAAAVGVTDGLLRFLTGRELAGVLAHEISHVRSDDLWIMTLADTLGRATHALAYAGMVLLVLGVPLLAAGTATVALVALVLTVVPTIVTLLQLALSRSREYDADLEAARLTGDPDGLAGALHQLERAEGRIWERLLVPHRRRTADTLLLRTHPPTEERIRRLRELVPQHAEFRAPDVLPVTQRYARVHQPSRLRPPGVWW